MDGTGKSIVLIGMMGAGKSSVGRLLQRETALNRFDTDELVAAKFGTSIPEIFFKHGEEKFREAETGALRELADKKPAIIVTGGGIVLRDENIDLLKQMGLVVWLEADEETLFERASRRGNRPLLQTEDPRASLAKILNSRTPLYARAADMRIETTRLTHDEVVDIIMAEVERRSR